MKHEIHTIWAFNQMRRIQTKNMKIIYDDKKKYINFDKRISWRSFFTVCSDWMNKRRKLMIVFWYMIYKTNHKHMIHKNRKSMKHCCSWITYEHEHELDFDHDQKSHHKTWCEYEDFKIFSVAEKYCNKITSLAAWRSQWNSQPVLDHDQEQTCEFWKSFSEQLKAIQKLCQWF